MKLSQQGLYELPTRMMLARHHHQCAACPQHLEPLLRKLRSKMVRWQPQFLSPGLGTLTLAVPRERVVERGADYHRRAIGSSRECPVSKVSSWQQVVLRSARELKGD